MSSRNMTITEIKHTSKAFDDTHTIKVSGFKDDKNKSIMNIILETLDKINSRLDKIDSRLDKIEKFDEFVEDQFKKHGWIK